MKRLTLLSAVFISLLVVQSLNARIINVPAEYTTIQAGIDSSANGDTVLVQPGVYYEHIGFNGHNIVLGSLFLTTGDTSYISSTIITTNPPGPVVGFFNDEDSTTALVGFTISHNGVSGTRGIGIWCYYVDGVRISNNLITGNINNSSPGGGIVCDHANPIVNNNRIIGNRTFQYGGGIFCNASNPIIRNNFIKDNYSGW